MHIEANSVEEYIHKAPERRQDTLRLVCDRVKRRTPDVEETLEHHMPFYKLDGDSYIAVASQKHHVSLYVVMLDETLRDHPGLSEAFANIDRGKNCLRFRDTQLERLDADLLDELIDATYEKRSRRSEP